MGRTRRGSGGSRRGVRTAWCAATAACVLSAIPPRVPAATLVIDVLATDDPEATQIIVAPGARVPYAIVGEVFSDDATTPDNDGLASLTIDLTTDFGVEQPPANELDAAVVAVFTFLTDLGVPLDDDVTSIGGLLLDLTNPTTGLAVGGPQVIARGELVTPETEGTFHVMIAADGQASVLVAQDSATEPFVTQAATLDPGDGLTVVTQNETGGGTTGGAAGGTTGSPSGGGSASPGDLTGMLPGAIVGGGATILLAALGALQFGPIGFVLGLFLGVISSLTALFG